MSEIVVRDFKDSDAEEVASLVEKIFYRYIAKDFTTEGIKYWLDNLSPQELIESLKSNRIFIAELNSSVVGMIRVKDMERITMFYVAEEHQGKGIGRELIGKAIGLFKEKNIEKSYLKSSLCAVPMYEKFGFVRHGHIEKKYGIIYQEMVLSLSYTFRA